MVFYTAVPLSFVIASACREIFSESGICLVIAIYRPGNFFKFNVRKPLVVFDCTYLVCQSLFRPVELSLALPQLQHSLFVPSLTVLGLLMM